MVETNKTMNILGTGLSGLVGTRLTSLLVSDFQFEDLSHATGIDITQEKSIVPKFENSSSPWVFHFAAITDVDLCEKERKLGVASLAWKVNVLGTENIVNACRKFKKKLLYLSTDYVFSGNEENYSESDIPDPKSWYALTKFEGEKRVLSLGIDALIVRIASPYCASNPQKNDFVHLVSKHMSNNIMVNAPVDQYFKPTFIDDIANAIKFLVENNIHGIYHVTGGAALTPFEAFTTIALMFGYDINLIRSVSFKDYYDGRAPRPRKAVLNNGRIEKLGLKMSTFDEGLSKIKSQLAGSHLHKTI